MLSGLQDSMSAGCGASELSNPLHSPRRQGLAFIVFGCHPGDMLSVDLHPASSRTHVPAVKAVKRAWRVSRTRTGGYRRKV